MEKIPSQEAASAIMAVSPALIKTLESDAGNLVGRYALSCGAAVRIAAIMDALLPLLVKSDWAIFALEMCSRTLALMTTCMEYPQESMLMQKAPEKLPSEPWAAIAVGAVSRCLGALSPQVLRDAVLEVPLRVTGSLYRCLPALLARAS